ncbi:hypothetical protein [Rhizobium leguminosarum]|nr:hypothetical protein [Rhizobium leguminosarum]MBP2449655.1 hypothetical protein [Rhizobium leguminosarum]
MSSRLRQTLATMAIDTPTSNSINFPAAKRTISRSKSGIGNLLNE